jgi:hypothetical protein
MVGTIGNLQYGLAALILKGIIRNGGERGIRTPDTAFDRITV